MLVVWVLLGAWVGWYLGGTAARTQFPPIVGIIAGFLLGAVGFLMFSGRGVTKLDLRGGGQTPPGLEAGMEVSQNDPTTKRKGKK